MIKNNDAYNKRVKEIDNFLAQQDSSEHDRLLGAATQEEKKLSARANNSIFTDKKTNSAFSASVSKPETENCCRCSIL